MFFYSEHAAPLEAGSWFYNDHHEFYVFVLLWPILTQHLLPSHPKELLIDYCLIYEIIKCIDLEGLLCSLN